MNKKKQSIFGGIITLFILLFPTVLFSAPRIGQDVGPPAPVILEDGKGKYPLGLHLDILEDTFGKYTIEEMSSDKFEKRWVPNQQEVPNFAFSDSVYWLRLSLTSAMKEPKQWFLEVAFPHQDYLDFYLIDKGGIKRVVKTGDRRPFQSRSYPYRNFLFNIDLQPNQTRWIYLRVQSEDGLHEALPLILWDRDTFAFESGIQQFWLGIFFGILIVMALYNLFIYYSVRDRSYLYYVLYIAAFVFWGVAFNGFSFQFFWPNSPEWANYVLTVSGSFLGMQITIFSRSFLKTAQHTPKMDLALKLFISSLVFVFVFSFFGKYSTSNLLLTLIAIPDCLLLIAAGIVCWQKGYRPARYFLIAWSALLIGIIFFALKVGGILPTSFLTEHGLQIGSILEVILLSLGLADRINQERKEKIVAQQEGLEAQRLDLEHQQELTNAYERFVPQEFLNQLGKKSIVEVGLGDCVKMESMTILFSDIRSFTTLSESMTPHENFNFLNAYLKRMEPSVGKYNGVVDKFIGDAIMALYPQSADDAVKSAISMQYALVEYNGHRKKTGYLPIRIGIGINTGSIMLGTIGAHNRMEGTVISDTVNLASRVEGMTKIYSAFILISDKVFHSLENPQQFDLRVVDQVIVKGKTESVTIWEVFNGDPPQIREVKLLTAKIYEVAVSLYYLKQFEEALSMFRKCLDQFPEDKLAQIYIERCQHYIEVGWNDDWDGVERLE